MMHYNYTHMHSVLRSRQELSEPSDPEQKKHLGNVVKVYLECAYNPANREYETREGENKKM